MRRADDSPVRRFTAALIGKTRFILLLGFGGLFVLMGFGVFQIERLLAQIQARSAATQQRFLEQNRTLTEIRSSLYLSGTLFRDYVLDTDAARSELQLQRLDQLNRATNSHLEQYEAMMPASEQNTFNQLRKEIESYWKVLNPALSWDSSKRAKEGYQFLREEFVHAADDGFGRLFAVNGDAQFGAVAHTVGEVSGELFHLADDIERFLVD